MYREVLFLVGTLAIVRAQGSSCSDDADCPPYNRCVYSAFSSPTCYPPEYNSIDCKGTSPGGDFPDHEICARTEIQKDDATNQQLAVTRCFETDTGVYRCGSAYKNQCTDTFNKNGQLQAFDDCPNNFSCKESNFLLGPLKVCIPNKISAGGSTPCVSDLDCGYSELQEKWSECFNRVCSNPIQ